MAFDINKTNRRYFPEIRFRVSPKVKDQLELLSQAHLSRSLSAYLEMLLNSVAAGQTDMVDILSRLPDKSAVTPAAPLPRATSPATAAAAAAAPVRTVPPVPSELDPSTTELIDTFEEWARVVEQHLTPEFRAKVESLLPHEVVSAYTRKHTFPRLDWEAIDQLVTFAKNKVISCSGVETKHAEVFKTLQDKAFHPVQAWLNEACIELEQHINTPQLVSDSEGNNLLILLEELKIYTADTYLAEDTDALSIGNTWAQAQAATRESMHRRFEIMY